MSSARRTVAVFAAVLAAALSAGCSTTVDGNPVAAPGATSQPPETTEPEPEPEPDQQPPDLDSTVPGWTVVVNDGANLAYDVPPDWTEAPDLDTEAISLSGIGTVDSYECEGSGYSRGVVGSTSLEPGDPATTATAISTELGPVLYGSDGAADVRVGSPQPVEAAGMTGSLVETIVVVPPGPCLASEGRISVLVLDATESGGVLQVFMLNIDTAGGPPTPGVRSAEEFAAIIGSLRQSS